MKKVLLATLAALTLSSSLYAKTPVNIDTCTYASQTYTVGSVIHYDSTKMECSVGDHDNDGNLHTVARAYWK